ncbi:MAG: hypothetical protein JJ900_15205 [Rhodospirillales bacterium]|nr:hypothetical protein [Rhodospirillales bacterium]MBO6788195.1 hypothetical protein [Rhodospirillales bacterium]
MACALLAALPAVADEPYYRLIYDYEVASFCGLVRAPVHAAYSKKRERLESLSGLAADELTDIRVGAMADAEREYINRGLGGHKPWCRSDGRAGVERILEQPGNSR